MIERHTGKTFDEAVREQIFTPLGLKRPGVTGSLLETQRPGEARYPDQYLRFGLSVMTPDEPTVPEEYGTKNWSATAGAGSLAFAPADYAKILDVLGSGEGNAILLKSTIDTVLWAAHPDDKTRQPFGERTSRNGKCVYTHGGTNVGSNALMVHMPEDRTSIVWAWNGGHEFDMLREQLLDTAHAIQSWPVHDLYPSLEIPQGIPGPA